MSALQHHHKALLVRLARYGEHCLPRALLPAGDELVTMGLAAAGTQPSGTGATLRTHRLTPAGQEAVGAC